MEKIKLLFIYSV